MKILILLASMLSLSAFGQVCHVEVNGLDSINLSKKQERKLHRILKKKNYANVAGSELSLDLSIEIMRSELKGTPTDSHSVAAIFRGDLLIVESKRTYMAIMNDVHAGDMGFTEFVIGGATEKGARRRLLKAVRALPDCKDIQK